MSTENRTGISARAMAMLQKARAEETSDPAGALIKLRIFGEQAAESAASHHNLARGKWERADQFIDRLLKARAISPPQADWLHLIRKLGNPAAHEYIGTPSDAKAARVAAENLANGLGGTEVEIAENRKRDATGKRSATRGSGVEMAVQFPWGDAKRPGFLDTWQAEDPGRKYFVARRGQVEILTKLVQVYPGSGISEIGYINLRPIEISVGRSGGIFTKDDVEIEARFEGLIAARNTEACLALIAEQRSAIAKKIESVVFECLAAKAAVYEYGDAYSAAAGFQKDVVEEIQARARERLPYNVEHAFVSIRSKNAAVHASREAGIEAAQTKTKRRLEVAEASRRRKIELAQTQHVLNLEAKRLQAEQNAALLRIDLEAEGARAKNAVEIERISKLTEIVKDVETYLAFVDPAQLVKWKTAKLTRDAELAKLMGRLADEEKYLQGKGAGFDSSIAGIRTQILGIMEAAENAAETEAAVDTETDEEDDEASSAGS